MLEKGLQRLVVKRKSIAIVLPDLIAMVVVVIACIVKIIIIYMFCEHSCLLVAQLLLCLFAGEPGRLIRDRYRTASQVIQNQVRRCLQILDLRYGHFTLGFSFLCS